MCYSQVLLVSSRYLAIDSVVRFWGSKLARSRDFSGYCCSIYPCIINIAIEIGDLPTFQHGVRGTLHIRNTRQIFIEDFSYDGLGPGTYVHVCSYNNNYVLLNHDGLGPGS